MNLSKPKEHSYESIYQKFGENLPWCIEEIPPWFKQLIKSKWTTPCKTLDIGCGVGNYAGYLAKQGFEVMGIDVSKTAISLAKKKYSFSNLTFKLGDAFNLKELNMKFDFIYEVSLLHNLKPQDRSKYLKGIDSILNSKGKFMICCFSDKDVLFTGKKQVYFPELNNTVYPLSETELKSTLEPYFNIEIIKKVYMGRKGKRERERFLCLMNKRERTK